MAQSQRMRRSPRFSLNALSEYLVASAARRRKLIEEQKHPKQFQVTYYGSAEEAIAEFLVMRDRHVLDDALGRLRLESGLSEWERGRRVTCAEAIRAFAQIESLPFEHLNPRYGPKRPRGLGIRALTVGVRPEVLLVSHEDPTHVVGAVKLYISKSQPLSDARARFAGAILHRYVSDMYSRSAHYKSCFVIDVFRRKIHTAPRTYKRHWQDVEAACSEIALWWDVI